MFRRMRAMSEDRDRSNTAEQISNLTRQESTSADRMQSLIPTVPVGVVFAWVTGSAPTGYLLCDGSAVSRSTYAALFALIGTTFGAGDGSTTFNLPDLRRRVVMGAGGTGTATIGNAVGNVGGEENHTLTEAEMPSHTHTYGTLASNANVNAGTNTPRWNGSQTVDTGATGGDGAHNNIQPSIVMQYIIRATA